MDNHHLFNQCLLALDIQYLFVKLQTSIFPNSLFYTSLKNGTLQGEKTNAVKHYTIYFNLYTRYQCWRGGGRGAGGKKSSSYDPCLTLDRCACFKASKVINRFWQLILPTLSRITVCHWSGSFRAGSQGHCVVFSQEKFTDTSQKALAGFSICTEKHRKWLYYKARIQLKDPLGNPEKGMPGLGLKQLVYSCFHRAQKLY